jgi:hypothetical protein
VLQAITLIQSDITQVQQAITLSLALQSITLVPLVITLPQITSLLPKVITQPHLGIIAHLQDIISHHQANFKLLIIQLHPTGINSLPATTLQAHKLIH